MGVVLPALRDGLRHTVRTPRLIALVALAIVTWVTLWLLAFPVILLFAFFPYGGTTATTAFVVFVGALVWGPLLAVAHDPATATSAGIRAVLGETYADHALALALLAAPGVGGIMVGRSFLVLAAVPLVIVETTLLGTGAAVTYLVMVLGTIGIYLVVPLLSAPLQFADAAVVIDGDEPIPAAKSSWRLARERPLSVAGYTLVRAGLPVVGAIPGFVVGFVMAGVGEPEVGVLLGVTLMGVGAVAAVFVMPGIHEATYRGLVERVGDESVGE